MRVKLENFDKNIQVFIRDCSYRPLSVNAEGEWNCVKPLQGYDYPRFHMYLKIEGKDAWANLHLDQKKPSYGNETMHSGDYDSELIAGEAERVLEIYRGSSKRNPFGL